MELTSQPDLRRLRDRDNTVKQWGADKRGDWRPRDYGDVGSLSGFNSGNNIPGLSRTPPEPDPKGDEFFPRNGFINRGNSQAVMGSPEPQSEISSRKDRNQLLASSGKDWKAEALTPTPPVKRRRFCNPQLPVITCSKQFEEGDSGQKCEVGKTNGNPDKVPFWSFEKKTERSEERISHGEIPEILEAHGVPESGCDGTCENGQSETEESSRSLEYQGYLKEMRTPWRQSQKISLVLADPCHGSATNKTLTNGSHLPVHHMLVSLGTSDFDQSAEDERDASVVDREPAEREHVGRNSGKWN